MYLRTHRLGEVQRSTPLTSLLLISRSHRSVYASGLDVQNLLLNPIRLSQSLKSEDANKRPSKRVVIQAGPAYWDMWWFGHNLLGSISKSASPW